MRVLITGASGWIGSAVVPELLGAGHRVVGLARSDSSAAALDAVGAEVHRGSLDDLDGLHAAVTAVDGVIHLAFKHDLAFSGDFDGAVAADRAAIETIGAALDGSDGPLVIASGTAGVAPGRMATEEDGRAADPAAPQGGAAGRQANAHFVLSLASHGVRSSVLRLPPTVHGAGDSGFVATQVGIARAKGVCGFIGDGASRWPAVHRTDAARLFRLALEDAPAGAVLHAVDDEGVAVRDIAEVIAAQLGIPAVSIAQDDAAGHFGWLAPFLAIDGPASSVLTRTLLGWQPAGPGLLADLRAGHYFDVA